MTNYKDSDKRLAKTKFAKGGGSCFECCDYESMYSELESFLHQELDRARKEERKTILRPRSNCCDYPVNDYRGEYSDFATCQKCGITVGVHEKK